MLGISACLNEDKKVKKAFSHMCSTAQRGANYYTIYSICYLQSEMKTENQLNFHIICLRKQINVITWKDAWHLVQYIRRDVCGMQNA